MKKKRITALALATMLFSSTAAGVSAAETYTWKYENNHWYYLNSAGQQVTGWVYYKNKWYYLDSNGVMKTGWLKDRNTWYYLDASGAMKTGWLLTGGKWYYLNSSGAMKTGWLKDGNSWYYLDASGAMKIGWIIDNNLKYYLSLSGAMVTGQKYIDGKAYAFSPSGALITTPLTGWFRDGKIVMYFDAGGVIHKGFLTDGGYQYYFSQNGLLYTGWLTVNNAQYYFAEDGKMQTGWLLDSGKRFYFSTSGVLQTSKWLNLNGKSYYLGSDGAAVTGWLHTNGKHYYFSQTGERQIGWVLDNQKWYYLKSDGTMATGWVYVNQNWYFMDQYGVMKTGWLMDNGVKYYLSGSGAMVKGWLTLGDYTYFFAADGRMVTGEQDIDGKTYYFFDNGVLNTGPISQTTNYDLTFNEMLALQMQKTPQTDKYQSSKAYVSGTYILVDANDPSKGIVTSQTPLNVREDTNTSAFIFGAIQPGTAVQINASVGTWYEIKYDTWRNAKDTDVAYYLNPASFSPSSPEYYQFLLLNKSAGTSEQELNAKTLYGKGILEGKAAAFLEASKKYNVNEVYLISHALLETGNGWSALAQGIMVDTVDGQKLDQPVKVYNMYGIGAFDSCPNTCGAETAYKKGWFTPEAAIIGGAEFIGAGYINAAIPQNTLYKMRWNAYNPSHQYATDIGWAVKQVNNIKKIYDSLSSYTLFYDIPKYQ